LGGVTPYYISTFDSGLFLNLLIVSKDKLRYDYLQLIFVTIVLLLWSLLECSLPMSQTYELRYII